MVVSPHAGATADFVRDRVNGLVVDPSDPDMLAAALLWMASDDQLRRRLGEAAFASTADRTPAATAHGYLAAVDAALGR